MFIFKIMLLKKIFGNKLKPAKSNYKNSVIKKNYLSIGLFCFECFLMYSYLNLCC